jgi:hypothetical protein
MDINQILEAIKGVEESAMNELDAMFNDWMDSEDRPYNDMAGDDRAVMGCAYRYLDGKVDLSKMEDYAMALTHAYHGGIDEAFTGYWKGTDAGTPGKKMVGADESIEPTKINTDGSWQQEGPWVKSTGKDPRGQVTHASDKAQRTTSSLEDRLRSQWEKTKREKGLVEVGMTTGGMSGMTTGDTQATPANAQAGQEIATITKNLQNLKSKAPDLNIQKATAALTKADDSNPLTTQDKDAASTLADPVANLFKDAQLGQQLNQLINKGMQKDQAAAQLAKQQGGV